MWLVLPLLVWLVVVPLKEAVTGVAFGRLVWRPMWLMRQEPHCRLPDECRELSQDSYCNVRVSRNNICTNATVKVGVPSRF